MSQPPDYNKIKDFISGYVGADLDTEFTAIEQTLDATLANIALIQRDDGKLANKSVHKDALDDTVAALLLLRDGAMRGAWAAHTVYSVKDVVSSGTSVYMAVSAHESQAVFADDLALGRWVTVSSNLNVSAFVLTLLDDATAAAFMTTLGISAFIQTLLDDADASTALSTLGVSAFVKTLLDDAAASNFLTTLGVSAFIQTLLDDADASTALTTLGVSAFIKTLLDDADASTALSTLGVSTFIKTLLDDADAATARTTLGLAIGTNVQAWDADLDALAGLATAADSLPYFTGLHTAALTTLSSFIRTLLDDADAATARTTLGLAIGTNVQAWDTDLDALAGLTYAADTIAYFTGAHAAATATLSSFIRTLLDDADAATARTTLGLGTAAVETLNAIANTMAMNGKAFNEAKGADIASAGTTNIGAATGNYFDITGTTTITAFDTVQAGTERTARFTGILTLTHNATSLILPSGANITTAAGDVARFVSLGSGNWRCVMYTKADGSALVGGSGSGLTLMTPVASTSGTSIDFTGIPATAKQIIITFSGVSTNGTSELLVQIGDAGGIETSGYLSACVDQSSSETASTAGFIVTRGAIASSINDGVLTLYLVDSSTFTWSGAGTLWDSGVTNVQNSAGGKSTSQVTDRVRITTVGGTATFDAGKVNVQYMT